MTIAWSSIAYAQPNILVNKRVLAWLARGSSLRPHLRVHAEIYLYIEGLPGVRNLNTWNSFRFFIRLLGKRTFLESGEKE
jgi:hypothetical protein